MSQALNQAGTFQGQFTAYGLKEFDSGALAVVVMARIDTCWDDKEQSWDDWSGFDCEVEGTLFIVKKDASINKIAVESLVRFADWDGSLHSIADKSWQPKSCQFSVEEDTYNEKVRYRINFLDDRDRIPGKQIGTLSSDKVAALEAKYGAALRAVAGSVRMNSAAPPPTKQPVPSKPKKGEPVPVGHPGNKDGIPFAPNVL